MTKLEQYRALADDLVKISNRLIKDVEEALISKGVTSGSSLLSIQQAGYIPMKCRNAILDLLNRLEVAQAALEKYADHLNYDLYNGFHYDWEIAREALSKIRGE